MHGTEVRSQAQMINDSYKGEISLNKIATHRKERRKEGREKGREKERKKGERDKGRRKEGSGIKFPQG